MEPAEKQRCGVRHITMERDGGGKNWASAGHGTKKHNTGKQESFFKREHGSGPGKGTGGGERKTLRLCGDKLLTLILRKIPERTHKRTREKRGRGKNARG